MSKILVNSAGKMLVDGAGKALVEEGAGPEPGPTPKADLESYTWAEIKQLSNMLVAGTLTAAELSSTYNINVGNTKTSTMNNENHAYRLIGLLHDVDANGKPLGMTFEQTDLMVSNYKLKSTMSATDNWANSDLITTINNFTIASDLSAVITAAKKVCAASVSAGAPTFTQASALWVMSETEISNLQSYTIDETVEGTPYAYYANESYSAASRKKKQGSTGFYYWLRSPGGWMAESSRAIFAIVCDDGTKMTITNTYELGVAPCFCI